MKYYYFSYVSYSKFTWDDVIECNSAFFPVIEVLRNLRQKIQDPVIIGTIEISEEDFFKHKILSHIRKGDIPTTQPQLLEKITDWDMMKKYDITILHAETGVRVQIAAPNNPGHVGFHFVVIEIDLSEL
jgi:hypothetical protein